MYVADPFNFCASEWGAATQDLCVAVNQLPDAKWERIMEESMAYVGIYKPVSTSKAFYASKTLMGRRSGRSRIVISDEEE